MPRLTVRPAVFGDLDAGPYANRHHQDIRRQHGASVEFDGFHLPGAVNCLGVGPGDDANAARLDSALKEMARGRIELAFHQGRHQMHDRDVHALFLEAHGGLQPEEPATDNHRIAARLGGEQHRLHVVEITVGEHAGKFMAGYRNDDGVRSGGDDEPIVSHGDRWLAWGQTGGRRRKLGRHRLGCPVDSGHLGAFVECDAVLDVPAVAMDHDFLERLFARQDR